MKILTLLTSTILLLIPVTAVAEEWPLKVDAGPEWKVEYKGDGVQFFALTRLEEGNVILMFSRWPVSGGKNQIPDLVRELAEGFLLEAKKNEKIQLLEDDFQSEKLAGEEFAGEAAIFVIQEGIYQVMFMLSDGDGIWNGQFTGSKAMWIKAKAVLEGLTKADEADE